MNYRELIDLLLIQRGLIASKRELRQLHKDSAIKYRMHDSCIITEIGKKRRFVLALKKSEFAKLCDEVMGPDEMVYLYPLQENV